jgi:hypothetical protein
LGRALWLAHLGVFLSFIHDGTPKQIRTYRLVETLVGLVASAVPLGHQRLLRRGVYPCSGLASRRLSPRSRRGRVHHEYWGARALVQFFYFDRSEAPEGAFHKVAEVALVGLFVFLTIVYGYATVS